MALAGTTSRVQLALILVGSCGCTGASTPAASNPRDEGPGETAAVESVMIVELETAAREQDRFWVLHDDGVRAHDFDGKPTSQTLFDFGDRVLRLPDGRVLTLSEDGSTTSLSVIDLDGRVTAHALPNRVVWGSCTPQYGAEGDAVMTQRPFDFTLSRAGTHACIDLALGPIHAEREIAVAFDLASYAVDARVVTHDYQGCALEPSPGCADKVRPDAWASSSAASPRVPADPWTTTIHDERLVARDGTPYLPLCIDGADPNELKPLFDCASIEATSTSARWLLVGGSIYEAETLVRSVHLFDRQTETLATFDCAGDHCELAPVPPSAVFERDERPVLEISSESDVAALPNDRLWIDGQLVIPERGVVVHVGGRLARMVSSFEGGLQNSSAPSSG